MRSPQPGTTGGDTDRGGPGQFPRSSVNPSTGSAPSYAPAPSPWLRRTPSPWPPDRRHHPAQEFPTRPQRARQVRDATRPTSAGFRVGGFVLRGVQPLVPIRMPLRLASRARPIRQCWDDPSLSRTAPPTTLTPGQPAVLQLPHPCCDRNAVAVSHRHQGSRTPRGARNR